jgi:transcription antitermination factor NusG
MLAKLDDTLILQPESLRLHSFDRWYIARAKPNMEKAAKEGLERRGFEAYYASWRQVVEVRVPLNRISSKTRHRRRTETRRIDQVRPIYPGYIFVRKLWAGFDVQSCYEWPGMLGLCMFSDGPAMIDDWKIEIMRVDEAAGRFDKCRWSIDPKDIRRGAHAASKAEETDKCEARELKRLDEPTRTIHFVEEFGRITRIITNSG